MRRMLPRRPRAAFTALACLAAPILAQSEDETTLDDLLRDAEEIGRQLDEQRLEFETTSALIGGSEPWPRPEPELTAEAWKEAVTNAPPVPIGRILEASETVRLSVSATPNIRETLDGNRGILGAVVRAAVGAGVHTDPDSELELRVELLLGETTYTFSSGGSETVHYLQTHHELLLPARVLRGDAVAHVPLVMVLSTPTRFWSRAPSATDLTGAITASVGELLGYVGGVTTAPAAAATPWIEWIGDDADARRREWQDSFVEKRRDLDGALELVTGVRRIEPWDEAWRPEWERALNSSGFRSGVGEAPDLRGELFFTSYSSNSRLDGGGVLTARSRLFERDAIAWIDGRYFRVAGSSIVQVSPTRFASSNDLGSATNEVQRSAMDEFMRALGHGGNRAGQVPHDWAPLVATFLRKRPRTELPDEFIDDLANRVAFAIAGAEGIPHEWKEKWIERRVTPHYFNLPRVGDARRAELVPRSVQEATRQMIDALVFADPLAFFAFDEPWSYNAYGSYQVPERFVELLESPRPSGAGALERVWVDGADSAAWDLADSYGQKAAYKLAQAGLREVFGDHRILVCYYCPADGNRAFSTLRYFWYEDAPEGWKDVLATLAPEIRMDRIGPPTELPPKYLQEADERIGAY